VRHVAAPGKDRLEVVLAGGDLHHRLWVELDLRGHGAQEGREDRHYAQAPSTPGVSALVSHAIWRAAAAAARLGRVQKATRTRRVAIVAVMAVVAFVGEAGGGATSDTALQRQQLRLKEKLMGGRWATAAAGS